MPLPKRKHSHARTNSRRHANYKVELPNVGSCSRCHAPKLSHHVCPSCGFYGNRMVVDVHAGHHHDEAGHEDHAE